MQFKEVRKTEHFREYHEGNLDWNQVLQLLHPIKDKRKTHGKFKVENNKIYILCELKDEILYIINVKIK